MRGLGQRCCRMAGGSGSPSVFFISPVSHTRWHGDSSARLVISHQPLRFALPYRVFSGVYTARAMALSLLKFGSKRDLRSDFRCNIKLLNENEVLEGIEFPVSIIFTPENASFPLLMCLFSCDSSTTNSEKPRVNFYWTIVSSTFTLKRQISSVYDSPTPMTKR